VQSFTGLAQDVLVFGTLYIGLVFPDVPDGSFNQFILGLLLISIPLYLGLTAFGWYYDKRLQLWSPDWIVRKQRDPYSYVPEPRMFQFDLPYLYGILYFYLRIQNKLGIKNQELVKIIKFLDSFWKLSPRNESDMQKARELRAELGKIFAAQSLNETISEG
jgi:hypothetical protein